MAIDSLKKAAVKGIVQHINEELIRRTEEKDEEINNFNVSVLQKIIGQNEPITVFPFDIKLFKETRERINQRNYQTPTVLNAGNILEWQEIQGSRIYKKTEFEIRAPMLLPVGYNAIGFVNNIKYSKEIHSILESMAMKVIAAIPDGLFRVTIIDKDATGASFGNLIMFNGKITESKIISKDDEISIEMQELRNTYQRVAKNLAYNGFDSVESYNKTTEEIPQPYKIIMIANFPHGFDKESAENLLSLLEAPEKAGYYFFISFALPQRFDLDYSIFGNPVGEFLKKMTVFSLSNRITQAVAKKRIPFDVELVTSPLRSENLAKSVYGSQFSLLFESMDEAFAKESIRHINKAVEKMSFRPVIPIEKTVPQKFWTKSPFRGVSVPFAKNGIETVYFSIGVNQYDEEEPAHHAMICGSTGSGKTVTIHDIILHAAMRYSPEDLRFWLLDYKEGTEFAIYRDFPTVEILSMESEIEFGHEVLEKVISEMSRRGRHFKMVDARNLQEYHDNRTKKIENAKTDEEKREWERKLPRFPRIVLIIDEFQVLYPNVQAVKNKTNEYIRDILRRGRSFGFNLILSTQTLKGVDLSEDIMSNIPLRVALKMDEKDAIKLFNEQNTAPKFLKFPGEGIYNNQFGESVKNVPFQAFFAREEAISSIKERVIKELKDAFEPKKLQEIYDERFVYVGNIPGKFDESVLKDAESNTKEYKIYIGDPAGLSRERAHVTLKKEYANNMIVVGNDTVKAASIFKYLLDQLIHSPRSKEIYIANTISEYNNVFKPYGNFAESITNKNYEEKIDKVYKELLRRQEMGEEELKRQKDVFIVMFFINSLLLFSEDAFVKDSSKHKLFEIIKKGPELGIHSVLYIDSYTSAINMGLSQMTGFFGKKISLSFFENDLKIFSMEDGYIEKSKSKVVAVYSNGEHGHDVKKFKPFIYDGVSGSESLLNAEE